MAIPRLLQNGDFLLASHTGSGKTLAYLLPIIHHIKEAERSGYGGVAFSPQVYFFWCPYHVLVLCIPCRKQNECALQGQELGQMISLPITSFSKAYT